MADCARVLGERFEEGFWGMVTEIAQKQGKAAVLIAGNGGSDTKCGGECGVGGTRRWRARVLVAIMQGTDTTLAEFSRDGTAEFYIFTSSTFRTLVN